MSSQRSHRREPNQYDRSHGEWTCGKAALGDACGSGPNARGKCLRNECRPIRTAFSIRKLVRYATGSAGLFVLLACLISDFRQQTFAPGPLTQAHAQILQGTTAGERCATCHPAGRLNSLSWFASIHPSIEDGKTQSQLCLECHQRSMPQLAHGSPHNVDRDVLVSLRNQDRQLAIADHGAGATLDDRHSLDNDQLACSVCHREHHGFKADLQFMANDRCQSCHRQQFASFQRGHPDFEDYPYRTESQIRFSHRTHQDKHFVAKNESFDCRTCHLADSHSATGNVIRSVPFETACARCHQQSLKATLFDGMVVLQLPSFDGEVLEKHGLKLGAWPTSNLFAFEGKVPPMMRWLLSGDPSVRDVLGRLPDDVDIGDLDWQRREVCEDLVLLANGIRALIDQVGSEGQPALLRRLEGTPGLMPTHKHEAVAGIPPDIFRRAYELWFQPHLPLHVSESRRTAIAQPRFAPPQIPSGASESDLLVNAEDDLDLLTDDSIQEDAVGEVLQKDEVRKQLSISAVAQGGWLIDESRTAIVYIGSGHGDGLLAQWLTIASINHSKDTIGARERTKLVLQSDSPSQLPKVPWTSVGQPRDTAWHRLLDPSIHGGCGECHILESSNYEPANNANFDLWHARSTGSGSRTFTKFDHRPHLLLGSLTQCIACHQLKNDSASVLPASVNRTEQMQGEEFRQGHLPMQSEFQSMRKADCVTCHRVGASSDQCTTCHNYHVGEYARKRHAPIRTAVEPTQDQGGGHAAIR